MKFNFIYDGNGNGDCDGNGNGSGGIELKFKDELKDKFSYQLECFQNMITHEILFRKIVLKLMDLNLIDKTKNIIDVGGYVGDNSLPWAKNIDGLVYCIEPSDINVEFIKELIDENSIENIKLFKTCISDKEEILSTNNEIDKGHNVSFVYDKRRYSLIWNKNETKKHQIKSTTFDILLEKKEIDDITFMHIDVEGLEMHVLNGSKRLIDEFRPIVIFEVHLNQPIPKKEDMIDFFKDREYSVYIIDERCGRKDCRNFLAIPCENNDKIIDTFFYKNLEQC
jgi:FkbM family methyltransferase